MNNETLIPLLSNRATGILSQLAKHFNVQLSRDCQQETLVLPPTLAENSKILVYTPSEGIDCLIVDAKLKNELILHIQGDFPAPLSFFSQVNGELLVRTSNQSFRVRPLQCSIYAGFTNQAHTYYLPADKRITFMLTMVHKAKFFEEIDCETLQLPDDLLTTITSMSERKGSFLFQDIFHLPAIDAVKEIINQKQVGMLNSTFATAKIFENLYLQLQQYELTEADIVQQQYLEREQLEKAQNAKQILVARLLEPPTIPELARMVGTNQQYLKQSFRKAFGKTINQYLNDLRLEQAGILIQGGKLTITEIAAKVGYNSSAYFSRRFKEKYGIAPKNFTARKLGQR